MMIKTQPKTDIFKLYLDSNSISNKILYKRSSNFFVQLFFKKFKRYGILKIVKFDDCHIFTVYKHGVQFISIKYYNYSFNRVDVTYRGISIVDKAIKKTYPCFNLEEHQMKTARRPEDKEIIVEYFNKMLIGEI